MSTEDNNQGISNGGQYLDGGHHECLQLGGAYVGIQMCPVYIVKLLDVHILPGQALYYSHTGNAFLKLVVNYSDSLPYSNKGTACVFLPDDYNNTQHWHHSEGEQG